MEWQSSRSDCDNHKVINYIDSTFDSILEEIKKRPHGNPCIKLQRISSLNAAVDDETGELIWNIQSRQVTYGWPGKNREEAWRFACVGRILDAIYKAIKSGLFITKRDIYYHDPSLYKKQDTVDKYVDDIAYTCGVTRKDLNVVASPRGLIVGLADTDDTVDVISEDNHRLDGDLNHIKWILVIEKEATFKTLVECRVHRILSTGSGLLITARGYPDLTTRHFLRNVLNRLEGTAPVYGLFDADPDGLDIFRCYSIGSRVSAQQTSRGIPEMKWLGMAMVDIGMDTCLPLSTRDRTKARGMLVKSEWLDKSSSIGHHRSTLQQMLMLNVKAELQALNSCAGGIARWIERAVMEAHG